MSVPPPLFVSLLGRSYKSFIRDKEQGMGGWEDVRDVGGCMVMFGDVGHLSILKSPSVRLSVWGHFLKLMEHIVVRPPPP